jgi:hypothetical protein
MTLSRGRLTRLKPDTSNKPRPRHLNLAPAVILCRTRVGRLCDLTGKLSLSTEEFRLVSMLILRVISIESRWTKGWNAMQRERCSDLELPHRGNNDLYRHRAGWRQQSRA